MTDGSRSVVDSGPVVVTPMQRAASAYDRIRLHNLYHFFGRILHPWNNSPELSRLTTTQRQ